MFATALLAVAAALPLASCHISIWHPSMYGFNATDHTYNYDNRPVTPLTNYPFSQWWFHNHLDHPPNPGDFFELPAGRPATTELACNKGATTWFNSSEGGDIRQGNSPCPNSPPSAWHTNGLDDVKGCALAIAYESDVTKIQPEDFTVFSVNQTCVWTRFTDFQVPARMPPCPPGGCHCAWFWIHSQDSGGEQNYMNGFKCNITGSTSNVALAKPQVPRRCGADPDNGKHAPAPGNCTYGAKQPFYWFQSERNNMFEGTYSPPFYTDLYNFRDGAQDDIFADSYPQGIPVPSANSTVVPTPFLGSGAVPAPTGSATSYGYASSASSAVPASASTVSGLNSASAASSTGSASSSGSTLSGTFSASTLSQTASPSSAAISSSLSPELPLSTHSASLSSGSASFPTTQASAPVSESVSVTTSTVVSTLVITLTTGAPAQTSSASALSSSSFFSSASFSSASASSAVSGTATDTGSAVSTSAPARSTIFLNAPSASASPSVSQSDGASKAAPTTIDLNFAVRPNGSSSEANIRAAVRPGVFAANSNGVCKRQFKRKVALRRRAEPQSQPQVQGESDSGAILSRINVPGLRRHRRLQERGSLWRMF